MELYLKNYFSYFGSFSYDKAKEHAEKEKQPLMPTPLQVALVNFAQNEKLYYSLAFMEQKSWFGRKEPLRNSYQSLKNTFLNIQRHEHRENFSGTETEDISQMVSSLCVQLADFCSARASCIGLYTQIPKILAGGVFENIIGDIETTLQTYSENLLNPLLLSIKETFMEELNALISLFRASHAVSNWEYVNAIICIQDTSALLSKWKPLLAQNQGSSTFRSGFFSFGEKSNPNPTSALCDWFEKFFNFLVAKFTFYFYKGLNSNAAPEEIKSAQSKTSFDYVSKCTSFMRKSDAKNISLYLDTRETQRVPQHCFTFSNASLNPSTNIALEDYMVVLSLPQLSHEDNSLSGSFFSRKDLDFQPDKIVHTLTADKKLSVFSVQIEPRLHFVVTYNGIKNEKDNSVTVFFNEILQQLKTKKVGLLLKPGGK